MPPEDPDDDGLHYAVAADELAPGERVIVDAAGREVAVFNLDGEYFAVMNYCPHMSGPCGEGMLTGLFAAGEDGELTYSRDGEILCCPWHGWEFDLRTGEHLAGLADLITYDVTVRDGDLYVVV